MSPITKEPVNPSLCKSAACIPVIVNGIENPSGTFCVFNLIVKVFPSITKQELVFKVKELFKATVPVNVADSVTLEVPGSYWTNVIKYQ